MSEPCRCWVSDPPILHADHCCFMDDPTPLDELTPGMELACGHWHPDVPRPDLALFAEKEGE